MLYCTKYYSLLDLASVANFFSSQQYHQIIKLAVDSEFRSQTNPLLAQIIAASYFRVGDFQSALNLLEEINPLSMRILHLVFVWDYLQKTGRLR